MKELKVALDEAFIIKDGIMPLRKYFMKIFPESMKIYLKYLLRRANLTEKYRKANNLVYQHRESVKEFKKALYQFSCGAYSVADSAEIFIKAYLNKSVKPIRVLGSVLKDNDPVLICITRDNLHTVKTQVEYHRKIGVKHFAYLDNMSKDGTFEWLREQPDVSLFVTDEVFHDQLKDAWKRQVTDFIGYDRWYLALDPDELFIYPGIEKKNINMYIDFLESRKIKSALSPMIDMYSNGKLYEESESEESILDKYCYFDVDTYKMKKIFSMYVIEGGPRMRLLSTKEAVFPCVLQKCTLIKLSKDMLIGTHENYPYNHNFYSKGAIAFLLHYKFLPADNKKFKELINAGAFLHNKCVDFQYRRYVEIFEQNPDVSFYHNGSQRLNDSMDLMKINIIDKTFFKNFLSE